MLSFLLSSGTKPIRSQLLEDQNSTQMVYTHPTHSDGCFRVRRGGGGVNTFKVRRVTVPGMYTEGKGIRLNFTTCKEYCALYASPQCSLGFH